MGSALRPKRRILFWNRCIVVMIFCFCSDTLGLRKVLFSPLRSKPKRTESLGTKRTTHVSHTDSEPHCHVLWLRCEVAQLLPRVRVPKPIAQQLFELFHKLLRFPTNELGHLGCAPSCISTLQPLRVEYRACNKHTPLQTSTSLSDTSDSRCHLERRSAQPSPGFPASVSKPSVSRLCKLSVFVPSFSIGLFLECAGA